MKKLNTKPTSTIHQARPDQQPSGFVWWYAPLHLVDWEKGLIPMDISAEIVGEFPPPSGCGGKWFKTEEGAMIAFNEAVQKINQKLNFLQGS
jgi:hypothetical protein